MRKVRLGDVVNIKGGGTPDKSTPEYWGGTIPWASVKDFKSTEINTTTDSITQLGVSNSSTNIIPAGTIIIPTRMAVGKAAINSIDLAINQDLKALFPKSDIFTRYLLNFLLASSTKLEKQAFGATVKGITLEILKNLEIPLPPIAEQKRIAEILDRAEEIRSKRREAIAQLNTLNQAIFLEMFGDPVTNPKGWSLLYFNDLLSMPLRNGLSPSNTGKVTSKVLTLSAITGNAFDEKAWKSSTFQSVPPITQRVDQSDFLICRGNGNIQLVGKGYFPTRQMPEMTFPDTIIAARILPELIERQFLQHIWNSRAVRRQLETLARTTNGTFKVNQTMLEGIVLVVPPLPLQSEFAHRVEAVEKLKATHRASLSELDALFASLQHRAFRGEL
ncbi:restriction endonuclease subunit S [Microcoleus sp. F6_B4]